METIIVLKREDIKVTGVFPDCYQKYAANTAAINSLLPEGFHITEKVWLHDGNIEVPLYISTENPQGFTLEEYEELNSFSIPECIQCINGKMHWLPENGNWSIKAGADVYSTKYAELITKVDTKIGKVVIPKIVRE